MRIHLSVLLLCCVAFAMAMHSVSLKRTKPGASMHHLRKALGMKTVEVPLGGNIVPLGIFYMEAQLGTPGVTFNVAFDTGSGDLIVPGAGCKGCHLEKEGIYTPSNSSTGSPVSCNFECVTCNDGVCGFSNTYETCNITDPNQPCTVSGPVYTDKVELEGLSTSNMIFGLITFQTANFQQFYVIDGVIGFNEESSFGAKTPFDLFVEQHQVENVFSWCLNAGKFPHSGVLTLGGADPTYYSGSVSYTPLVHSGIYGDAYEVDTTYASVGGKRVARRDEKIAYVLDSGTNTLLLGHEDYTGTKKAFLEMCDTVKLPGICETQGKTFFDGACFEVTDEQAKLFPTVSMGFESGEMTMGPAEYLLPDLKKGGDYKCFGILPSSIAIIGDVLMKPYYTIIDRENGRWGWADVNRANCLKGSHK